MTFISYRICPGISCLHSYPTDLSYFTSKYVCVHNVLTKASLPCPLKEKQMSFAKEFILLQEWCINFEKTTTKRHQLWTFWSQVSCLECTASVHAKFDLSCLRCPWVYMAAVHNVHVCWALESAAYTPTGVWVTLWPQKIAAKLFALLWIHSLTPMQCIWLNFFFLGGVLGSKWVLTWYFTHHSITQRWAELQNSARYATTQIHYM